MEKSSYFGCNQGVYSHKQRKQCGRQRNANGQGNCKAVKHRIAEVKQDAENDRSRNERNVKQVEHKVHNVDGFFFSHNIGIHFTPHKFLTNC